MMAIDGIDDPLKFKISSASARYSTFFFCNKYLFKGLGSLEFKSVHQVTSTKELHRFLVLFIELRHL